MTLQGSQFTVDFLCLQLFVCGDCETNGGHDQQMRFYLSQIIHWDNVAGGFGKRRGTYTVTVGRSLRARAAFVGFDGPPLMGTSRNHGPLLRGIICGQGVEPFVTSSFLLLVVRPRAPLS